jgi:hypothetical protein
MTHDTTNNEKKSAKKKKAKKEKVKTPKKTSNVNTPPMSPTTRAKLVAAPRKAPLRSTKSDDDIKLPLPITPPPPPVTHLRSGDYWLFGKCVFCTYCDAKLNIPVADVLGDPAQRFNLIVPHFCTKRPRE